ncbi:unnamed protein product [marine sediment metagenome]|uniref:Uncharacterized protein n=1 Tax=marine sediment metagenome TaxID=412755 RepID=X1KVP7_9ZZZZ
MKSSSAGIQAKDVFPEFARAPQKSRKQIQEPEPTTLSSTTQEQESSMQ